MTQSHTSWPTLARRSHLTLHLLALLADSTIVALMTFQIIYSPKVPATPWVVWIILVAGYLLCHLALSACATGTVLTSIAADVGAVSALVAFGLGAVIHAGQVAQPPSLLCRLSLAASALLLILLLAAAVLELWATLHWGTRICGRLGMSPFTHSFMALCRTAEAPRRGAGQVDFDSGQCAMGARRPTREMEGRIDPYPFGLPGAGVGGVV